MNQSLITEAGKLAKIEKPEDLDKDIRDALPDEAENMFIGALKSSLEDNPDAEEGVHYAMAWDAVNDVYKKSDDGDWVKRESAEVDCRMIDSYIFEEERFERALRANLTEDLEIDKKKKARPGSNGVVRG